MGCCRCKARFHCTFKLCRVVMLLARHVSSSFKKKKKAKLWVYFPSLMWGVGQCIGVITDHEASCLQIGDTPGGEKVRLFCTQS